MEAPIPDQPRRFTRAEYHQMGQIGLFAKERVELLYGRIVPMSPIGPRHARVVARLNRRLVLALEGRAEVRPGLPFAAADDSEPEPDFGVYPLEFGDDHPSEALLLIEISDTSLARDIGLKAALYAQAGVPEYWVVDLPHAVVRVHRTPTEGRWTEVREHGPGERIRPLHFQDVALNVTELLAL